jgi:hypothetical protein
LILEFVMLAGITTIEKDDVFDSVLCVLAGADFFKVNCFSPEGQAVAQKEG